MLIRSELLALGVDGAQMRKILADKYNIRTGEGKPIDGAVYSLAISGKRSGEQAVKIRNACWNYINEHKRKEG